jgi:hypothetical protein
MTALLVQVARELRAMRHRGWPTEIATRRHERGWVGALNALLEVS